MSALHDGDVGQPTAEPLPGKQAGGRTAPTQRNRPTEGGAAPKSCDGDKSSVDALSAHVAHFQARVIADALADATASTWERRAADFERARPRPGDYPGRATDADLAARDARLAAMAQACRNRAAVSLLREVIA